MKTLHLEDPQTEIRQAATADRRRVRWGRRAALWRKADEIACRRGSYAAVPWRLTSKCGRVCTSSDVNVHHSPEKGAWISGVATCGSVWACPVCSAKIRTRRTVEVEELATRHAAAGGVLSMLTLTLPHTDGDSLASLVAALSSSFRKLQQRRDWRRLHDAGLIGHVRSLEVTHGFESDNGNGWHPHLHVLLLWSDSRARSAFDHEWARGAWADYVQQATGRRPNGRGLDHRPISADAAAYVTKIAQEMTRADLKGGGERSPWQLIDALDDGESWAIRRWTEFVTATKGRRAVQMSHGLRELYELGADVDDVELAAADEDGDVIATIPGAVWRRLCRCSRGQVPPALLLVERYEKRSG